MGQWAIDRKFEKKIDDQEKEELISGWEKAVLRAKDWED